jgi:hypothetical protein
MKRIIIESSIISVKINVDDLITEQVRFAFFVFAPLRAFFFVLCCLLRSALYKEHMKRIVIEFSITSVKINVDDLITEQVILRTQTCSCSCLYRPKPQQLNGTTKTF